MSSQYPEDEFDNPPADAPVGVHRQPASRWRPVLPFLAVIVVVPLLAWAFSEFLMRDAGNSTAGTEVPAEVVQSGTEQQSAQQSEATPAEPETGPLPEPEPEEPVVDENVDFATNVEVLNVAGIDGLGAATVARLAEVGFTSAYAGNMSWDIAANTVYYQTPENEATARKVAETLGITEVYLDETIAQPDPVVVFMVTQ